MIICKQGSRCCTTLVCLCISFDVVIFNHNFTLIFQPLPCWLERAGDNPDVSNALLSVMTVSLPACLQCPEIDSSSDEGIVPDKFDSTIEFKNVCFSYPTRPDVQASILSTCISHLGRIIISVHTECGVLTP